MATIMKTNYHNNYALVAECAVYVDTINKDSYVAEMYNMCIKYIRTKTVINDESIVYKREKFLAIDETDIYYNKGDGYWIVANEKDKIITLCKRVTFKGMIYNTIYIEKIFTLTCNECPKIVPKIFKKPSTFETFTEELTTTILAFRNRTNTLDK